MKLGHEPHRRKGPPAHTRIRTARPERGALGAATRPLPDQVNAGCRSDGITNSWQEQHAILHVRGGLQQRLDRLPHGAPPAPQLPPDPVDAAMLATQLTDRPPTGPGCQLRPRSRDALVLLDERRCSAFGFGTSPTAFAPHDPHRAPERGRIDQPDRDRARSPHRPGTPSPSVVTRP